MGFIRQHKHPNPLRKLFKELKVATQAEVDQLAQEVQQIHDNLVTAKTNIEDRFATLEKAVEEAGKPVKEAVDLTPLADAIGTLTAPATELENLEPVAAAPPAATSAPETAAPTSSDGTAVTEVPPNSGENPEPAPSTAPAGAADTTQEDAARTAV